MAENSADIGGPPSGISGGSGGGGFEDFYPLDNFTDFSNDNNSGGGPPGPRRGNRGGPWRGRGGGRGGSFDNAFSHRGMQSPRFRGGRGGFMGQGNMRPPGPRGPPGYMGNRGGGKFRQAGPGQHGDNWQNNGPPHGHMSGGMGNVEENVWAEAKSPDGKSYFYHTETRETRWERPEGLGVRIIRHEDVGSITSKSGATSHANSDSFANAPANNPNQGGSTGRPAAAGHDVPRHNAPGPGNEFGPPSHGNFASGPQPSGPGGQHFQQPPPNQMQGPPVSNQQNNDGNRMPIMPSSATLVRPNMPFGMPPQFRPPGPGFPMADGAGPGTLPTQEDKPPMDVLALKAQLPTQQAHHPPGFPGFGPMTAPPPFVMQPPPVFSNNIPFAQPWGPMGGVPAPTGVPPPLFNVEPVIPGMDPKVIAKAYEWSEHISPDGKTYFYNSKSNASTWEKPPALVEFEEMQKSVARTSTKDKADKLDGSGSDAPKAKESKKIAANKLAAGEKCRPISSTPVQGTPWCVVWTGDKRVFFFNPSTKQSVWDRPKDLVGRLDVDELVRNCPDKFGGKVKKAEATSTTSPVQIEADKILNPVEPAKTEPKDTKPPGEKRESESEGDPPTKKLKTDDIIEDDDSDSKSMEEEGEVLPDKKEDDKIKIDLRDSLRETNASEAEARAAKERATHPLEVRLQQFREMLIEKQVSAFSTWEKELHKIVFDSRYLLLTSKERKAAFDNYVKERAEEERKEKKSRMKQVKEHFMKFLDEVQAQNYHRMSYNEFCQKYGRDERFKAVEKSRDRETYFLEHTSEVKRREKEERAHSKEKIKDLFLDFLKDKIYDYHIKWPDVRKKFETEPRFSQVDPDTKEELFRIHQKRLKADAKARKKKKKAKNKEKARRLREKSQREHSEDNDSEINEIKTGSGSKSDADDSKSEKMEDVSEEEGCITDDTDDENREEREKKEREAVSMREREKEVQRALAGHLRDRDKEREHYRHEEAVSEFQSLLADLVRTSDVTWKEAKKAAKRDRRWISISVLPKEEMEDLFMHHCENISRKKKNRFRELLEEAGVKLTSTWKEIRKKIRDDPRYMKFSSSERKCEREFELYLKDKSSSMKTEFRELLKETKMLNYRTKQLIRESPNMMKDIEALLGKDKRYLTMDSMPEERQRLLVEYFDDLERKGAPPPPTASEPSRRMKV